MDYTTNAAQTQHFRLKTFGCGHTIFEVVKQMELKTAAISLGVGLLAGATAVMMMPKRSKPYQVASDVADTIKSGVNQVTNTLKNG